MSAVPELLSSMRLAPSTRIACPDCSHERKKYNEKDLAIHEKHNGWKYHCHHCFAGGFVPFQKPTYRKVENNVIPMRTLDTTKLQAQHYNFLKTRGISERVADEMVRIHSIHNGGSNTAILHWLNGLLNLLCCVFSARMSSRDIAHVVMYQRAKKILIALLRSLSLLRFTSFLVYLF